MIYFQCVIAKTFCSMCSQLKKQNKTFFHQMTDEVHFARTGLDPFLHSETP